MKYWDHKKTENEHGISAGGRNMIRYWMQDIFAIFLLSLILFFVDKMI